MHLNRKILKAAFCAALILAPAALGAQSSSINTFSPYSFYGMGDIATQGTAAQRAMGGAGVAFRSWNEMSYLNPASYGSISPRSALFSIGGYGQNFYLSQVQNGETVKSSYNTFNLSDIGFSIPLAKNLGFGFSVAPYSNVGYRVQIDDDGTIGEEGMLVMYNYLGEGGINQFKAGVGWRFLDRIAIGADLLYFHGNITRSFNQSMVSIMGEDGGYQYLSGQRSEQINTILALFGVQADIIKKQEMLLTFGATYQLGSRINGKVTNYIPYTPGFYTGGTWADATRFSEKMPDYSMPHIISAGLFLQKTKWGVGADYVYSMWGSIKPTEYEQNVSFRDTHTVKVGGMYIPNPGDVRYMLNRWTYRAGFRYSNYYMTVNDTNINEMALTFGLGIPLNAAGLNRMDLGLELGTRGTRDNGLIKGNFLKFSIGFTLFGDDFWFVKYKYD